MLHYVSELTYISQGPCPFERFLVQFHQALPDQPLLLLVPGTNADSTSNFNLIFDRQVFPSQICRSFRH